MKKCAVFCLAFLLATGLRAQTIISDGFYTNAQGSQVSMNGRTPDTADLPGGTYAVTALFSGGATANAGGVRLPAPHDYVGYTGFNTATYMNIASNGTYTKPELLTVSLDLNTNTLQEDNQGYARGIGLGFFTQTPANGTVANTGFTGLNYEPNGTLTLEINGVRVGTAAPAPAGYGVYNFYTLSYQVDTTTGLLSHVIFNGVDDSAYFAGTATGLTAANTNLVGYYGSTANNSAYYGVVDNFVVTGTVPEPSTWAMLGLGAVGAGVVALRHRRVRA